jgi:hypothetical protein
MTALHLQHTALLLAIYFIIRPYDQITMFIFFGLLDSIPEVRGERGKSKPLATETLPK